MTHTQTQTQTQKLSLTHTRTLTHTHTHYLGGKKTANDTYVYMYIIFYVNDMFVI